MVAQGTRRVLVVDDEEAVRTVVRLILGRAGYAVLSAATADEALRLAEAGPVDLVLMDLCLHGGDGKALAARLTDARPGLRVLYLSGEDCRDGIDQGAFLSKPFGMAALLHKVQELLGA
jgi:DNA-binding response OmpR family regulator